MKYILTLVLLLIPTTLFAQEQSIEQFFANKSMNGHVVKEKPIAPYFAEKYLRGDAWAAWAIEYNKAALKRARETATPGTEVRVDIGSYYYPQPRSREYPLYRGAPVYKSYSTFYIAEKDFVLFSVNPNAFPKINIH